MATGTATPHYHGTLTAATVDTITTDVARQVIQVVNVSGAASIYFTIDGSTPTTTLPAQNSQHVVPAGIGLAEVVEGSVDAVTVVKLISTGTPVYSVIVGL